MQAACPQNQPGGSEFVSRLGHLLLGKVPPASETRPSSVKRGERSFPTSQGCGKRRGMTVCKSAGNREKLAPNKC